MNKKIRPANICWLGLIFYVITADAALIIGEIKGKHGWYTMSTACEQALLHPVKRWPVSIIWTILTLHLFDVFLLPGNLRRFEPIGFIGGFIRRNSI